MALLAFSSRVPADLLKELQPGAVEEPTAVRELLERLRDEGIVLRGGINGHLERETATLQGLDADSLTLGSENLAPEPEQPLYLTFVHAGQPYFFWTRALGAPEEGALRVALPVAICYAERRDRDRTSGSASEGSRRVQLRDGHGGSSEGWVADRSPEGLGIELAAESRLGAGDRVRLQLAGGLRRGQERWAEVRHRSAGSRPGWVKLGLALRHGPPGRPVPIERRDSILATPQRRHPTGDAQPVAADSLPERVRILSFENEQGEPMRAICDGVGDPRHALVVIIPPAWGRTKETLLPLAATLLASFSAAKLPLVVVRFDGVRKRGESYRDPDCRARGREYHRLTFSQGARDILATVRFLQRSPVFQTTQAVIVSASASAIDARRAVAEDGGRVIQGWVSVNGAHDLQTTLRVISGGIDYLRGTETGLRFGLQEYLGVEFDMDFMNRDALEHRLGFLDDACRDLNSIQVPVTWIHGRYDGWMDLERVRQVLSSGDASKRRLIEVPTGHQVRTSREAFQVFELIASEIGRMIFGREIPPTAPDRKALERRREAERRRLPRSNPDLQGFWREYLIGREDDPGMELINSTDVYRAFVRGQIEALSLRPGERVADLGAGTGTFADELARTHGRPAGLLVDCVDYVRDALQLGRSKLATAVDAGDLVVHHVEANLDARRGRGLALRSESYDAVLAALLIGYLSHPEALLKEIHRILRPGGRLVLSSLRKDADASKIHLDVLAELQAGRGREVFKEGERRLVEDAARGYLNNAARIFDFEESGAFRFWDAGELGELLRNAKFDVVDTQEAFGTPPQAIVLLARKK